MNVHLVSAYVPIKVTHRTPDEYFRLGKNLEELPVPKSIYFDKIEDCWMHRMVAGTDYEPRHAGDYGKNTMDYHIVQHQKTTWMQRAAQQHPEAEVLVWMDFGIFHMGGVTRQGVIDFLWKCKGETGISIPGAWPKGQDGGPCWRFNGSILICHRDYLDELDTSIRATAMYHAAMTRTVIWEVNIWDMVETQGDLPIKWYGASHNGSMLTEYRKGL